MHKEHKLGFTVAAALVTLAIALASTGCATSRPYTRIEKSAFWFAAGGCAADVVTTGCAVYNTDLVERNPTMDGLENGELIGAMIIGKAVVLSGGYLLGEYKPDWRVRIYSAIGGVYTTAAVWNTYQISQHE